VRRYARVAEQTVDAQPTKQRKRFANTAADPAHLMPVYVMAQYAYRTISSKKD